MTHIPDEAVQAAVKAYSKQMDYNDNHDDAVKAALTSAIPYLSAPCAVEVKKLEWKNANSSDDTTKTAQSIFGEYCVWVISGSGYFRIPREYGGVPVNGGLEGAFAAAQADFDRRILSCVATKPVDVAAVRRQAFEEGFENGVEQSLNALDAHDDITRNEAEQGIRKLKPDYRALSAEPAQ